MATEDFGIEAIQGFEAVPRDSVVSVVARRLLENLTSGRIAPGTRLPSERQLAATLEVGRSAVREALSALDLLGIVEIRPGSGTYVRGNASDLLPRSISWGLMLGQPRTHELVEVRQYLEVITARLAAERGTDEQIAAVGRRVEEMRNAVDDVGAFVDADVSFHLDVALAAQNSVLSDILHSVRELLHVWVERTSRDPETAQSSLAEHAAVFAAIRDRDPKLAGDAMQTHMAIASDRLRRSLAEEESLRA